MTALTGVGEIEAPSRIWGPLTQSIPPAMAKPHCGPLNENRSMTKLFLRQKKPRRQARVLDHDRLFAGPLGPRHTRLGIAKPDRPRIALMNRRRHRPRKREMRRARREPPLIDDNAPRRRVPMKSAIDLVDHHGFIVGIVETQIAGPKLELTRRLGKHPIAVQTEC